MKHTWIDKAALKAESEKQQIPFSNLLAGYVLEAFMYLLTDSAFGGCLWLKSTGIFGVEQYRKKNILTLEFAYLTDRRAMRKPDLVPGQKLSLKMGYVILASILKKEKIPEIKWMGRAEEKEGAVELDITGELEEMTVPLHLRVTELAETDMVPVKKQQELFMEQGRSIEYLQYPAEIILAEQLFLIIENMELIPEMTAYGRVCQILMSEAVDGRHIRDMLWEKCEDAGIIPEEDRVKEILSYKNYTYMRKRWEKYLRHRKLKEPSWDAVMETIEAFLVRIWHSICEDEVFFGDWMPGLMRFLD